MFFKIIESVKRILQHHGLTATVPAGLIALNGCAALGFSQNKPPIMAAEIVRLSQENVPAETIIKKMHNSGTVYRFSAAQLAQLHDQGVQDQVINYMQQTYLDAVRREQDLADWNEREMWGDHFW